MATPTIVEEAIQKLAQEKGGIRRIAEACGTTEDGPHRWRSRRAQVPPAYWRVILETAGLDPSTVEAEIEGSVKRGTGYPLRIKQLEERIKELEKALTMVLERGWP
jgi:hypothetical protein